VAYNFWFDALAATIAAQAGAFLYLEPLFISFFSSYVLEECMFLTTLFEDVTILVGVWLVNRPAKYNPY